MTDNIIFVAFPPLLLDIYNISFSKNSKISHIEISCPNLMVSHGISKVCTHNSGSSCNLTLSV